MPTIYNTTNKQITLNVGKITYFLPPKSCNDIPGNVTKSLPEGLVRAKSATKIEPDLETED